MEAPINYDDATKRLLNKLTMKYGIPRKEMQEALPDFNPQEPDNVYTEAHYKNMMRNVSEWKEHNPFYKVPRSVLETLRDEVNDGDFSRFEDDEKDTTGKKNEIKRKLQAELDRRVVKGQTGTVSTGGKRKTKKRRRKRKTKRKKRKTKKRRRKRKRKTKKKRRR